jgi:hypothetical protein
MKTPRQSADPARRRRRTRPQQQRLPEKRSPHPQVDNPDAVEHFWRASEMLSPASKTNLKSSQGLV